MKFALLVTAAALAALLVVLAVPTTFVTAASDWRQIHLAGLNPLHAAYDDQRRLTRTATPALRRIDVAPVAPPDSLRLDLGSAFEEQSESQIQNDRRIQELQAYTRKPEPTQLPVSSPK